MLFHHIDDASKNTILILGCQRSGTTLLKMILGTHPKIDIIDHDYYYRSGVNDIDQFINLVLARSSVGKICCVKGPQLCWHHKLLKDRLPYAKILWIFRDPAEVATSMVELSVAGNPWLWHYDSGEGSTPAASVQGSGWEKCANIWLNKNLLFWKYDAKLVNYHELCKNPRKVLLDICEYCGIDFIEKMLHHNEFGTTQVSIGGYDHSRPIEINKRTVEPEIRELVDNITGYVYQKLLRAC